jgi:heme oxygenase (mycobilin-producing)
LTRFDNRTKGDEAPAGSPLPECVDTGLWRQSPDLSSVARCRPRGGVEYNETAILHLSHTVPELKRVHRGMETERIPRRAIRERGTAMAVKVLLTRQFRQDKLVEADKLLMELRSMATLRTGYISGETLISADNPNKVVVVSTWSSRNRWESWLTDNKRIEFTKKLNELLEVPEQVEVYFTGDKSLEWVHMA